MKKRIHFKDEGQDITYLDVDLYDITGRIVGVSPACSNIVADIYINNAVLEEDIIVGNKFYFAIPKEGFKVYGGKWTIESIENID